MQCVACLADLAPGRNAFSASLGGALCPRCGPGEPSARPIDTDVLKVLRNLQRAGLPGSAHFRVPEMVMREVERTLRDLIERHTERRLRSPDLLARLRAEPTQPPMPAPPDPLATPEPEDLAASPSPVESTT
jgi:DNA repair protein RecO (recombination protein O)